MPNPICPVGPKWEELKKAIQEAKPKLNAEDVETWAYVAFDEFSAKNEGDIPNKEQAFDILFPKEKTVVKKGLKKVFNDVKQNIKRGFEKGMLVGQIEQGKAMVKDIAKLQDKLAKSEISADEYDKQIEELKKDTKYKTSEAYVVGQIEQGKKAAKEIRGLEEKVKKGELKQSELKDRIKELEYEGRFKEAEAKLAAEIEGKKAGRKEGGREEKNFQKEFATKVSVYLDELTGKGKIDNIQAQTIARKAAKVGTSDAGFKRFTDYVDNVVERADYANEMTDIKSLQKSAIGKKSPLSSQIKAFTNINPENLPLDMITKYKQALDLLTGKVPNPKLMVELSADIEKIKAESIKVREYDAVKTAQDAMYALKDIKENKVKSIEDYVDLIKDTNRLKRKLNQLLENEDITDEEFEQITSDIATEQSQFEEKYKNEINDIKDNFINDIKENKIEPTYETSPEQKELIEEVNNIPEADLKNLSIEDLYVLNEAVGVANDGYIDISKFHEVLTSIEANKSTGIAKELGGLKSTTIDAQAKKIAKTDITYWASRLGISEKKIGTDFWKKLIAPFNKGLADYTKGQKEFGKFVFDKFKENKIDNVQSHRIGIIIHYLQEYSKIFNDKYKNVEGAGTIDEFGLKLNDENKTRWIPGKISEFKKKLGFKDTESRMREAYESLPKGKDGMVNLKDVYDDFSNGGNKYLTENERKALDAVVDKFETEVSPKQEYANNLRGRSLEKIMFYMPRIEYREPSEKMTGAQPAPTPLRIASPYGKERIVRDVQKSGLPMTDFGYLMNKAAKNTYEDYFLTKMLSQTRKTLDVNLKELESKPSNQNYLLATKKELGERLKLQLQGVKSDEGQKLVDRILSATAVKIFFDPVRALKEAVVGFVTYPIRSKTGFRGYAEVFKNNKLSDDLKSFTNSPIRIKENINANFDIDTGKVSAGHGILQEGSKWLSGFTEAHFNNMIWMPTFRDAFKEITGQNFDGKRFTEDVSYRNKFKKQVTDAGSVADQETMEIVGPTTTGARRRMISIPGMDIEAQGVVGKLAGFVSGYTNREYESVMKATKDFSTKIKQGDVAGAASELQKPLGIIAGITMMGYLSNVTFYLQQYAIAKTLGEDDSSADYAKQQLMSKLDWKGASQELTANFGQLALSKYGSSGRILADAIATGMYYTAKTDVAQNTLGGENAAYLADWSQNVMNNITYHKVPALQTKKGAAVSTVTEKKELSNLLVENLAVTSEIVNSAVDALGGIKAASEFIGRREQDVPKDKKDAWLLLKTGVSTLQFGMMFYGSALPMQNIAERVINTALAEDKQKSASKGGRGGSGRSGRSSGR